MNFATLTNKFLSHFGISLYTLYTFKNFSIQLILETAILEQTQFSFFNVSIDNGIELKKKNSIDNILPIDRFF